MRCDAMRRNKTTSARRRTRRFADRKAKRAVTVKKETLDKFQRLDCVACCSSDSTSTSATRRDPQCDLVWSRGVWLVASSVLRAYIRVNLYRIIIIRSSKHSSFTFESIVMSRFLFFVLVLLFLIAQVYGQAVWRSYRLDNLGSYNLFYNNGR